MDPFTLALLGGAVGGLLDKKNPLRGAAMGAAGGYFAPGLMAGGGAAGGAAGQTAGLLGVPGAASGTGSQAAMLAAQNEGFGAVGQQLLAEAAGGASGLAVPTSVNMAAGLQKAGETLKQAKPFMDAAGTAMQIQGMFQEPPPPVAQSSLPQRMPMDLSGLFSNNQVAQMKQQRLARRGLLG